MSTICHKKVLFGTNVYQKNGQNPSIGSLTHPKKLGLSKRVEKTIHATGSVHWMSATNRPRKIGQNFWWQFKRTRDFGASWYLYYFRDILIHRGKKKKKITILTIFRNFQIFKHFQNQSINSPWVSVYPVPRFEDPWLAQNIRSIVRMRWRHAHTNLGAKIDFSLRSRKSEIHKDFNETTVPGNPVT